MPSYSQIQQITISGVTNTGNPNAPAYLRKGDVNTTYERLNKYNDAERTELLYYDESGQETTDPINPTTGEPTREIVPILKNARPIWRKRLFSSWPDISYADIYYDGSNWIDQGQDNEKANKIKQSILSEARSLKTAIDLS